MLHKLIKSGNQSPNEACHTHTQGDTFPKYVLCNYNKQLVSDIIRRVWVELEKFPQREGEKGRERQVGAQDWVSPPCCRCQNKHLYKAD